MVDLQCTESQQEVVVAPFAKDTLLNVISGPGSGKTRTLCARVAYLMSEEGGKLSPDEILVLSLTNRTVDDFKHKLVKLIGNDVAEQTNVMTFHAFAASVINERFDDWQILEDQELRNLCELVPRSGAGTGPRKSHTETLERMRQIIKKSREIDSYDESLGCDRDSFTKIRDLVGSGNMFTYDDILDECARVINSDNVPEFVNKYKVIIVDEFQDVYPLIANIVVALCEGRHLTIAGDPNQSIYGFMGATAEKNWKRIAKCFPSESKKLITLTQAFRSTPEVLELSAKILGSNHTNVRECVKESVNLPTVRMTFNSSEEELNFVYKEIHRLVHESRGMIRYSDVAVLCLTNQEVDTAGRFFRQKQKQGGDIGVNRLNSTPQWLRTQLSNLIQYMKILNNPYESFSLLSSLNLLHGVGLASINRIYVLAARNNISAWELLQSPELCEKARVPRSVPPFVQFLSKAIGQLDQNDPNAIMITLLEMGRLFGLKNRLITSKVSDAELEEYEQCLRSIHSSLVRNLELKPASQTLLRFYLNNYNSHVLLNPKSNFDKLYNDNEVNFSTVHMAKGLEFPVVFMLSPNNFYLNQQRRRVLYVGVTRASALLYFNRQYNQRINGIDEQITSSTPPTASDLASVESRVLDMYAGELQQPQEVGLLHRPPALGPGNLSRLLSAMGRNLSGLRHIAH